MANKSSNGMRGKGNTGPGTGAHRAKAPASNRPPSGPRTAPNSGLGKVRSGGGLGGAGLNKIVRPNIVTGQPQTRKVNVDTASNIGRSIGDHATDSGGKPTLRPAAPMYQPTQAATQLGNAKALEGAGSGARPGGGNRVIMRSGSQGQHGPSNPGGPPLAPTPSGGPGGFGFKKG